MPFLLRTYLTASLHIYLSLFKYTNNYSYAHNIVYNMHFKPGQSIVGKSFINIETKKNRILS
jgi:hypothetical protein